MLCIKVVQTPSGEAPEWVRQAWVGLTLPLASEHLVRGGRGVLSDTPSRQEGYAVFTFSAVTVLELTAPEAARWWREETRWVRDPGLIFIFQEEVCQVVNTLVGILPPSESDIPTFGQFVEYLKKRNRDVADWFIDVEVVLDEGVWNEALQSPLNPPIVISLAREIACLSAESIHFASGEMWQEEHDRGHAALKAIYEAAQDLGMSLELDQIDQPLSYVEAAVRKGYVALTEEGNVVSTPKTEAIIKRQQRALQAPNN